MFRALSSIICGNEDHHQHIRRLLVTFCRHNKEHFEAYCHPVPIDEHINGMANDRVWGTDLEIHAAAALWQVKIYVCLPDTKSSSYSWIYFTPVPPSKLTIPSQCDEIACPPGVFHFELFYAWRCHYDIIVGLHGYIPENPPQLPQIKDTYITL